MYFSLLIIKTIGVITEIINGDCKPRDFRRTEYFSGIIFKEIFYSAGYFLPYTKSPNQLL